MKVLPILLLVGLLALPAVASTDGSETETLCPDQAPELASRTDGTLEPGETVWYHRTFAHDFLTPDERVGYATVVHGGGWVALTVYPHADCSEPVHCSRSTAWELFVPGASSELCVAPPGGHWIRLTGRTAAETEPGTITYTVLAHQW